MASLSQEVLSQEPVLPLRPVSPSSLHLSSLHPVRLLPNSLHPGLPVPPMPDNSPPGM